MSRRRDAAVVDGVADVVVEGGDRRRSALADLTAGRDPVDGPHDLVIPAEHDGRFDIEQLERGRHDSHGERSGQVPADLRGRAASAATSVNASA